MDIRKINTYKSAFDAISKSIEMIMATLWKYGMPESYKMCWDMRDGKTLQWQ